MYFSALCCVLSAVLLILSSSIVQGKEVPPGVYTYQETVELDERPWYQPLSYSLRQFLGSERESDDLLDDSRRHR